MLRIDAARGRRRPSSHGAHGSGSEQTLGVATRPGCYDPTKATPSTSTVRRRKLGFNRTRDGRRQERIRRPNPARVHVERMGKNLTGYLWEGLDDTVQVFLTNEPVEAPEDVAARYDARAGSSRSSAI
ncbi:hypothetical protein WMF26_36750 [Sorangium sp. So ce185]